MRRPLPPHFILPAVSGLTALCLHAPAWAVTNFDEIPAAIGPAEATQATSALPLQLEIVINGVSSGAIIPVWDNHGQFSIAAGDLRALELPVEGDAASLVAIAQLTGVTAIYDAPRQRLNLQVPTDWLQTQAITLDRSRHRIPAHGSTGLVLNYDLYAADAPHSKPSVSLWNELRLFSPMGMVSSTGILRHAGDGVRFMRYDTRWTRSDEDSMTTYEAGDIVTRSLPWSSTIRLGGVQISRDFSVRPDVVTYPVPSFAGEAALPSAIELFIDNHQAFGGKIQPGPFTMTPLPQINGAGQASIVVTDALGRQVTTTIPFYVSSTLLRAGLTDYAVSAGLIRQNYGLRNFDYGQIAASGSIRHGLTDTITLEAHAEGTQKLAVAGLGAVVRLGVLGVVNAAYSYSHHSGTEGRGSGGQIAVGYQYQRRNFSFAVNHTRQSAGFTDLGMIDRLDDTERRTSTMTSVSASLALGRFGSLGAGYFDTRWRGRERVRLLNASWSLPLGRTINLYASATHEVGTGNWSGSLNLMIPLGGKRGTVSSNVTREENGDISSRIDYTRSVPTQGGFGWSASVARLGNGDVYADGDVTWRTRDMELRGGAYGTGDAITPWFGASGSLVWMDGALFTANRVADAFALVSTGGRAGVPIYYENQLVGRSNADGHILVPWAAAYYAAKYAVDPLELGDDLTTDTISQNVAIKRGSGYVIDFPIRQMIAAKMIATGADGKPLPVGSVVRINGISTTYVGWDGVIFADNLTATNDMAVTLPDSVVCRATFTIDINAGGIADLGTVPCQ